MLLGSQARGDAHEHSDVDLVALGDGPDYVLRQVHDVLMSVSWRTPDAVRRSFADPSEAGGAVPGWRSGEILHDADGTLALLVDEARRWRWNDIETRRRTWVAAQATGWAEEVHRLVGSLMLGRARAAAVNRNLLATHLPMVAAVHMQILYESENRLYDLVGEAMGERWRNCHDAALGLHGEDLNSSSRAALGLYSLLAPEVDSYLSIEQRAVVSASAMLAESERHAA